MVILDEETGPGKVDLSHGRIEQLIEQASENDGRAETQYMDLGVQKGYKRILKRAEPAQTNQDKSGCKRAIL